MRLHTASEVISFTKELESESAKFYQDLSQRYDGEQDAFLSFAKENGKNSLQIERAYYGVISDAIEGCFAFDIEPSDYTFEIALAGDTSYSDALGKAVDIEEKIIRFYTDAVEQSKSLMADVPRNFTIIAKKRNARMAKLKSLVEKRG